MGDKQNMNTLKGKLRLDLNQKTNLHNSILSSPDLNMLKVGTPELDNMIIGLPNTPTPSLLFPSRTVTAEQENFVEGFEEVLSNLRNQENNVDSNNSTQLNDTFLPNIKEEPQTVPSLQSNNSPPVSPVDMDYQERLKLERKRQRNRLAASKCRSRKLERISKLEEKVKQLKTENTELASMVNQLKENVSLLKFEVLTHNKAGCELNIY